MQRPLGIFEDTQAYVNRHFPFNVVAVLRLCGAPDASVVQQAFETLRVRHPLLGVRIRDLRGCPHFDTDAVPAMPLRIVPAHAPWDWRACVEEELATPFDLGLGPLARVVYREPVGGGREADLLLSMQHAILDAESGVRLLAELLELCVQTEPEMPCTAPPSMPPAAERSLPARFRGWRGGLIRAGFVMRQMVDEMDYRWRTRRLSRARVHPRGRARILSMQLPVDISTALVHHCRRNRLTLNSVLCAALLRVVARHRYPGEERLLRHFVFANLRPYVRPSMNGGNLGSCFSMLRFTTWVREAGGLHALAGRINTQVYQAARRGEKFLNLLMSGVVMRMMLGQDRERMGHTALSYTGATPLPRAVGPIRVDALHAFVNNFVLGPEYTAMARLFGGCLCWDIVYLDCDMDVEQAGLIAQDIITELEEYAHAGSP